jgi:endoplasmic reticulum junction formation protein lunapark
VNHSVANGYVYKANDSSPASFEKTLSALSSKIADTQAKLDRTVSKSRRIKVLWTLYLTFAYLVYVILLILVVGYGNIGVFEWTGLAAGPVV